MKGSCVARWRDSEVYREANEVRHNQHMNGCIALTGEGGRACQHDWRRVCEIS